MLFVGDGTRVFAAEVSQSWINEALERLRREMPHAADKLRVYRCTPWEVVFREGYGWDWAHPAEYAAAQAAGYDMPTMDEVFEHLGIDPSKPPGGE